MAKAIHAQIHAAVFVPGGLGIPSFTTKNSLPGDFKGMELDYKADGLYVSYKNVTFVVPSANVASVVLAEPSK